MPTGWDCGFRGTAPPIPPRPNPLPEEREKHRQRVLQAARKAKMIFCAGLSKTTQTWSGRLRTRQRTPPNRRPASSLKYGGNCNNGWSGSIRSPPRRGRRRKSESPSSRAKPRRKVTSGEWQVTEGRGGKAKGQSLKSLG